MQETELDSSEFTLTAQGRHLMLYYRLNEPRELEVEVKPDRVNLSGRERVFFARTVHLPKTVDPSHAEAHYFNGILQLSLPLSYRPSQNSVRLEPLLSSWPH